ncbi:MAG: hypothetical protein AB1407_09180, partial [Spirochaetota bacterium]
DGEAKALEELEAYEGPAGRGLLMDPPQGAWDLEGFQGFCSSLGTGYERTRTESTALLYKREADKQGISKRLASLPGSLPFLPKILTLVEKLPTQANWPLHVAALEYQRDK